MTSRRSAHRFSRHGFVDGRSQRRLERERIISNGDRVGYVPLAREGLTGRPAPLYSYDKRPNFGDLLSPILLERTLGVAPFWVPIDQPGKILFIGSIIDRAMPGDLVIGSGAIRDRPHQIPESTVIVGLRGPRTAALLGIAGSVPFGDPGVLAATAYGIERSSSNGRIALVPHYVDLDDANAAMLESQVVSDQCDVLDVGGDPETLLRTLATYEACISSSLHGVIAGESIGIPTVAIALSDRVVGGDFKFHDYFEGTGRSFAGRTTLQHALSILTGPGVPEYFPDLTPIRRMMDRAAEELARPSQSLLAAAPHTTARAEPT